MRGGVPVDAVRRRGERYASRCTSKLVVKAGTAVTSGNLLAEIDGQPMFVLLGSVPAWRNLTPGQSGRTWPSCRTR